jgi:hypothetical protein
MSQATQSVPGRSAATGTAASQRSGPPALSNSLAWWSAATILLSAFLLFQVQPVITKKILPWFGGSPAVWTTCVLFFQLVLLGGYAYAHLLTHKVQPRWQAIVHLTIVIVAVGLLMLFFPPSAIWKPADGSMPALRILTLLAAVVAAPYFVLSTTGPLIQAWFARLYPGRSPYRLYSLSNIGSLAALLTYPFLIEWLMKVDTQAHLWSVGFIAFATLIAIMALGMWRFDKANPARPRVEPAVTTAEGLVTKRSNDMAGANFQASGPAVDAPPRVGLRVSWLFLAALASMAFLAITNHLCQDIAVVPFMWVIPLSLYLLSFIICFDNERWYLRKTFGVAAILMILWLTAIKEYSNVNVAMDYGQRLVVGTFTRPTFDDAAEAEAYAKKSFSERVRTADLHGRYVGIWVGRMKLVAYLPITFSKTNDKFFDGIGWVVGKFNKGLNWLARDRRPVKLESGETFASLDKNHDGKLTKEELPDPPLTSLVLWDANSDGQVTLSEFNQKAGKREDRFNLAFNVETYDFKEHVFVASAAYMLALFLICMVCHGELVKSKPAPKYLTSFYLSISAGGALGGLFVALVAPMIFKTHFEMAIAMVGGFVVGWLAIFHDGRERWLKGREVLQWGLAFVMVATMLFAVRLNMEDIETNRLAKLLPESWRAKLVKWNMVGRPEKDLIAMERNFYGTVTVSRMGSDEDPYNDGRALYNGRIWHGFQFTDPSRELEPSTYYVSGTGAALAVQENPRAGQGLRVAVIGLGSGSMAAHAQKGDVFRFYDIDPKVEMVAYKYFTYLDKIPKARDATVDVVMGDARVSLERELKETGNEGLNYDVIHLDAFSGDAIPAHLLTDESFDLYDKHLRKDERGKAIGIVVVHISNRYLDLEPVVAAIARKHKYDTLSVHKTEDGGPTDTASDWILVTRNEDFLNKLRNKGIGEPLKPDKEILWTDQYTALWPIMKD